MQIQLKSGETLPLEIFFARHPSVAFPQPPSDADLAPFDAHIAPEPKPVATVPDRITMRQARLALLGAGLLGKVDAAIDKLPIPQKEAAKIEWEYAAEVARDSSVMAMLGQMLGLDAKAIDALFVQASAL